MKKSLVILATLIGALTLFAAPALASGGAEHLRHCVEDAIQIENKTDFVNALDECHAAPAPIVPPVHEIVWGSISFAVVFFVLAKFAFPKIRQGLDERRDKIATELSDAQKALEEADKTKKENTAELNKAKQEAQKIIEEAKSQAGVKRNELIVKAEEEAANLKKRAEEEANKMVAKAVSDASSQIAEISLEVAEKVIGSSVNKNSNDELVKQFVEQVSNSKIKG